MDLDVAFCDWAWAALSGLARDRDGEVVGSTRLAVVLHVNSEGAGRAILGAGAGEARIVTGNTHAGDRNAMNVQVPSMVLVIELSARAATVCVEPEVGGAASYADFSAAGHFTR